MKPNFWAQIGQNLAKYFFQINGLDYLLDIIIIYHNLQYQKNIINESREIWSKKHIRFLGWKLTKKVQNRHETFLRNSADAIFLDSLNTSLIRKSKNSYGMKYEHCHRRTETDGRTVEGQTSNTSDGYYDFKGAAGR